MSKKEQKKEFKVEIDDSKVEVSIKDEAKAESEVAETEEAETEEKEENTLEAKVEELQTALDEQKDKYLRLFADFDNYKKRTAKERLELLLTAGKDVFLTMLPTLDDIERAIISSESAKDIEAVKEGFVLVKNKMKSTLQQKGLKAMESIGKEFNPDEHEAITKIPAPSEDMKGKVIDEIEKGYTLNDKIIRYAKVVVGE